MIARVPLRLTAAKLQVLKEVCKAQEMELPEFIEYTLDDLVRAILEGSDVGKVINKRLLEIWQKEIGQDLT